MPVIDLTSFESYRPRIVEALGRMGPAAIAGAVGIRPGTAHRYCYRLYVMGVLKRRGNGSRPVCYFLREDVESAAAGGEPAVSASSAKESPFHYRRGPPKGARQSPD